MARDRFLMLVPLAVWAAAGCSDVKSSNNSDKAVCSSVAADICREVYPGVFKVDAVESCVGVTREPEENEVPMSFCQPCQDTQAATRAEMTQLMEDGAACETSEDCAVVYVQPACDFACGGAFNKDFDVDRYNELATRWNSCTLCQAASCQESKSLIPPRCDKGRCVIR